MPSGRVFGISAAALLAAMALAGSASAGSIEGYVYNPFGDAWGAVSITANQNGNLGGFGQACTWESAPVGWYSIGSLPAGTYSVGMNEKYEFGRVLRSGVVVGSGVTTLNHQYEYPDYVGGIDYSGNPRSEWAQSFRATGTSVTSVSMRTAYPATVRVTIHDTDPNGAQLGPDRTLNAGYMAGTAAYWSAGEVPTVPGHIYCAKFRNAVSGGLQCHFGAVKDLMGDLYPDGKTWIDGGQVSTPLCTAIGQDDDGVTTTVNTSKSGDQVVGQWVGSVIGQTFTANGSSVLCASMLVGNGVTFVVSVHDSVGSFGGGGTQIGPAKYVQAVAWNARSMAVWAPGEVPTTPGLTYYVKIRRSDGQGFTIYRLTNDEYAGGACYIGGVAQAFDLSTTIACEASTGSTNLPGRVSVANFGVAGRTFDSATIPWQSSPAAGDNYVDYGAVTPYSNTKADTSSASNHSVALTGLEPNTLYHARVVSRVPGMRDGISRDFAFVTDPVTPNLLANPGFESGAWSPWTMIGAGDINLRNYPAGGSSKWFAGATAHTGNWFLGGASNGGQVKGGACQRVAVAPGRPVTLRAWLWTYQADQLGKGKDVIACGRVGIDPTGGTDPNSTNVVWSPLATAQDWWGSHSRKWIDMAVTATPTGGYATAFLQGGADSEMAWTVFCWDDVVLAQEPPLTVLSRVSDLDGVADGSRVSIPNQRVTASASQSGAAYIEQSDRAAGVRVESLENLVVGHSVSLNGYVGTKASGERYIFGAKLTADSPAGELASMATTARSVGNVGPGNVGLLMRVCGRVTAGGTGYAYLNDGSLAGNGLRVVTTSLTTPPSVGSMAAITGIVQLSGASPATAIPVLWPRSQVDCQTVPKAYRTTGKIIRDWCAMSE